MNQLTLFNPSFTGKVIATQSPINKKRLAGQNYRLLRFLCEGKSITCLDEAKRDLRIGYLNSRISDLVNKHQIKVNSIPVERKDIDGNLVTVNLYWLEAEEIKRVKQEFEV